MPAIADSPESTSSLFGAVPERGAEEIFVEPVNNGGPALKLVQDALTGAGYLDEANAISEIQKQENWSHYVLVLLRNVQKAARRQNCLHKLRSLLYPSRLTPGDLAEIKRDDAGVKWLGK